MGWTKMRSKHILKVIHNFRVVHNCNDQQLVWPSINDASQRVPKKGTLGWDQQLVAAGEIQNSVVAMWQHCVRLVNGCSLVDLYCRRSYSDFAEFLGFCHCLGWTEVNSLVKQNVGRGKRVRNQCFNENECLVDLNAFFFGVQGQVELGRWRWRRRRW